MMNKMQVATVEVDPFRAAMKAWEEGKATVEPLQPYEVYPRREFGLFSGSTMDTHILMLGRDRYIHDYGFVLLSKECVDAVASFFQGKRVLEIGAGTGYLAHCLSERGVDITALDQADPRVGNSEYSFGKVWKLDQVASFDDALPSDHDVVLLVWPCYDSTFAFEVASRIQSGQILVYQGESWGGCTANDAFFEAVHGPDWELLEEPTDSLNRYHCQFPGIHDTWYVYRRR